MSRTAHPRPSKAQARSADDDRRCERCQHLKRNHGDGWVSVSCHFRGCDCRRYLHDGKEAIVEFQAAYGATPVIHVATTRNIHDDVHGEMETLRMRLSQERDAKAKKDAEIAQLREQIGALKSGIPVESR